MNEEIKIDGKELIKRLRETFQSSEKFENLAYSEKCEIIRQTLIKMHGEKAIDSIKTKLPFLFSGEQENRRG